MTTHIAITSWIFNKKQSGIIININIENEVKLYPKILKHKYEKIVHKRKP